VLLNKQIFLKYLFKLFPYNFVYIIFKASGDALVSLKEMHCLQPRGRYEIKLYSQFIHLRGKTYDYSVPKENFVRFYLLPHPDERQIFFVLQVNPPITHGQTRYYFIILLFNNEDEINLDLNCSEQMLLENYNGAITKNMSGLTFEVVTKLYKVCYYFCFFVFTRSKYKFKTSSV